MNELIIFIDKESKVPIYQQIYEFIKKEIEKEQLKPGDKLPSSRALSRYLSISRSTAELAYDQLASEGYIEAMPCKGYYVSQLEGVYFSDSRLSKCQEEKPIVQERVKKYFHDFALNEIARGSFPYNVWQKLSKQVLAEADEEFFQLGNPCGEDGIRQAVAEYLYRSRGVKCKREQIIIGAGNDYLLMLLGTILGAGQTVAMEVATYISAYYDFRHIGYDIEKIKQDEQGLDISDLEGKSANIVYVMPSHQFPMGMIMPLKRRMALLNWAEKSQERYIIEDDYDSEFRYKGQPIPSLQGFDRNGSVIYMGTFSKSVAPSIRVSYMVLPERLMQKYLKKKHLFSVTVSKTDQKILELFLNKGYYEKHLNRMRKIYKNKHDLIVKYLKEMQDICVFHGENAGVHFVLEFINGLTEQEAIDKARDVGIQVYGVSEYCISINTEKENKVLLGYAGMEEKEIEEAMKLLKKVWHKK
ncbi:PLP-dependent aminotransferase family protein [Blautia hansenii]|uniref:MocR-like pyridoxine biosynthesis transcription factor PdxR n=1 Tax=Blautia hansenii TaxID=1322 RepID=UPI0022E0949F|nr:PLP-dependent aminotransferase family protein [Blautia hansenii]